MAAIGGWARRTGVHVDIQLVGEIDAVAGAILGGVVAAAGGLLLGELLGRLLPPLRSGGRWARSWASRTFSFLGLSLFLVSASPALAGRSGSPIRKGVLMAESSRSRAGGPPPPQPSAHDRGTLEGSAAGGSVHPAVHGARSGVIRIEGPLFDRSGKRVGRERVVDLDRARGIERAMRAHPAGKRLARDHDRLDRGSTRGDDNRGGGGTGEAQRAREHVVREGENLWSIAEVALETTDLRRIARYWPAIHRANRDVVGRDPSRIFPGQRLILPPEDV